MNPSQYQFRVRWGETDAAGIVYYPNFYKWMDEASHHFFHEIGFSFGHLFSEEKAGMPLLEALCKFTSPLMHEDEVSVRSAIISLKDKVFTIEHEFHRMGEVVASGYETRAWADFSNGKPKAVSIPNEIRKALATMQKKDDGTQENVREGML